MSSKGQQRYYAAFYSRRHASLVGFIGLFVLLILDSCCAASGGLPRSSHHHRRRSSSPWNPSSLIDADTGFLDGTFVRVPGEWEETPLLRRFRRSRCDDLTLPCHIRQVPGDGNCLFHSISLCLAHAVNGTQFNYKSSSNDDDLYRQSHDLRTQAVACLRDATRRLALQGRESLTCAELLQAAADQYNLSSSEYCDFMQQDSVWGGGPEIVALCNLLERPIHVYELATIDEDDGNEDENGSEKEQQPARSILERASGCGKAGFVLRRMACFGSPRFNKHSALHILSADSRFPDISPGEQLAAGNHFLAVFPQEARQSGWRRKRKRIRGGECTENEDIVDFAEGDDEAATETKEASLMSRYYYWWKDMCYRAFAAW